MKINLALIATLAICAGPVLSQTTPPPTTPEATKPADAASPAQATPPAPQQPPVASDDPLVIPPGSQFPTDVLGWKSARWGMSPKELETRMPEAKAINRNIFGRKDVMYTDEIDNFMLGNAKYKVYFISSKAQPQGLVEVHLVFSAEFTAYKADYIGLQQALIQKYGSPANKNDLEGQRSGSYYSASKSTDWVFPSTVISLSQTKGTGLFAERTTITIIYKATRTGVASGL